MDEDEKNAESMGSPDGLALVRVHAFDLRALYDSERLKAGDYLEAVQDDADGLSFSLTARRAADIDAQERAAWLAGLKQAFRGAMKKLRVPGDNIVLIRAAYQTAPQSVLSNPCGSLSDFLNEGDTIEILAYAGNSYLWEKGSDIAELFVKNGRSDFEVPEDASELQAAFAGLGISLDEDDIEAFLRDDLSHGGTAATAVGRCFVGLAEAGYDQAELDSVRALALAFAKATAKRIAGEKERPAATRLRSPLLALYEQFLAWMRKAGDLAADPEKLVQSEEFQALAEIMQNVVMMLVLLNHPDDCDAKTLRKFESALPSLRETVSSLFRELDAAGSTERSEPVKMYVFDARIADIDPPVRRLLSVPGNRRLDELHDILQTAFSWQDSHLHEFIVKDRHYAPPSDEDVEPVIDEATISLDGLSLRARSKLLYVYDFGDDWRHELTVKSTLPFEPGMEDKVLCIEGERAAPPEDCGGPGGYAELLELRGKPQTELDEEQGQFLKWAGKFDPEAFNLKKTNKGLQGL